MLLPEYAAVLNPFSEEGRKIASNAPPFEQMPEETIKTAIERIKWSGREAIVEPTAQSIEREIHSFYLMCQSLAAVCHPYSAETQYARESVKKVLKYRLYDLFRKGEGEFCLKTIGRALNLLPLEEFIKQRKELPESDYYRLRDLRMKKDGVEEVDPHLLQQFLPKWAVKWTDVGIVFKHNRANLTDFYLIDGWMILTLRDLWDLYAELIGDQTEEYIQTVYERMTDRGKPERLVKIGEQIARQIPKTVERLPGVRGVAGKLNPEYFPPCIHNVLRGVGSGLRNFAIVMLLTPFLSYARIAPSGKRGDKISDFIQNISVITEEIVPIIMKAAERCNPPLFSDQPQEKANIFYHMGFGMTIAPRLQDAGRSKWYMVPNCAKIQAVAPPLCQPDELCKKIKNPLTYYFRKKAEALRRRSQ